MVHVLLLDFRKAFDRVDHKILLSKLANNGVPVFMIDWVTEFLRYRKQRIKLGCNTSTWININAGFPLRTLMGPPCFLDYINDPRTICDDEKYVDYTSVWEACDRCGENSNMQTAANQAVK